MKVEISIVGRGRSSRYVVLDDVQSYAEDPKAERIYLWFENEDKAIKASAILDFIYSDKSVEGSDKDNLELARFADSVYPIERRGDMILLDLERYQISERL